MFKSRVSYEKQMRDKAKVTGKGLLTFAYEPPAGERGTRIEAQMLVTADEAEPFWRTYHAHLKRPRS